MTFHVHALTTTINTYECPSLAAEVDLGGVVGLGAVRLGARGSVLVGEQ